MKLDLIGMKGNDAERGQISLSFAHLAGRCTDLNPVLIQAGTCVHKSVLWMAILNPLLSDS